MLQWPPMEKPNVVLGLLSPPASVTIIQDCVSYTYIPSSII